MTETLPPFSLLTQHTKEKTRRTRTLSLSSVALVCAPLMRPQTVAQTRPPRKATIQTHTRGARAFVVPRHNRELTRCVCPFVEGLFPISHRYDANRRSAVNLAHTLHEGDTQPTRLLGVFYALREFKARQTRGKQILTNRDSWVSMSYADRVDGCCC